jgi:hypothetical protein
MLPIDYIIRGITQSIGKVFGEIPYVSERDVFGDPRASSFDGLVDVVGEDGEKFQSYVWEEPGQDSAS